MSIRKELLDERILSIVVISLVTILFLISLWGGCIQKTEDRTGVTEDGTIMAGSTIDARQEIDMPYPGLNFDSEECYRNITNIEYKVIMETVNGTTSYEIKGDNNSDIGVGYAEIYLNEDVSGHNLLMVRISAQFQNGSEYYYRYREHRGRNLYQLNITVDNTTMRLDTTYQQMKYMQKHDKFRRFNREFVMKSFKGD